MVLENAPVVLSNGNTTTIGKLEEDDWIITYNHYKTRIMKDKVVGVEHRDIKPTDKLFKVTFIDHLDVEFSVIVTEKAVFSSRNRGYTTLESLNLVYVFDSVENRTTRLKKVEEIPTPIVGRLYSVYTKYTKFPFIGGIPLSPKGV